MRALAKYLSNPADVQPLMKIRAGRPGDAVRRPRHREIRLSREMSAGIDVPVLGRGDRAVAAALRAGQQRADSPGHGGATGHCEGATFAEVVLHVHDDQSAHACSPQPIGTAAGLRRRRAARPAAADTGMIAVMIDMLLRNARLAGTDTLTDLSIENGSIVAVDPAATETAPAPAPATVPVPATEIIDLAGRLVTPPLVEPHIHLDAALTAGQPRPNISGSLFEGIAVWAERVATLTHRDVQARARQVLRWQLACGVQHVRSHVDVCDPKLTALRALADLRAETRGLIDLQLVAFPQQGILSFDGGRELMRRAVQLGADVVGAIPHFELTREDGVESVRFAMALAAEHGLRVDIHCDETDDDQSRFIEVMAAETIRRGMSGRVTASHTTAMHSYNNAYAHRLIANIARAGLHMVTNPLDNAVLQGRFDTGPIRRGHTRVKALLEAGVNVCVGHDSVLDPWYPLGYGDPLQAAFVLVHLGQMSGDGELRQLIDMITTNPAAALGLSGYGLRPGGPADLVVFDAPSEADALRLIAPRTLVLRAGKVVARSEPARHTVVWGGAEEPVTFLR